MQFLEKEIQQYTELVCATLLGYEVHPQPGSFEESPTSTVTGSVQITGEWNGAMMLSLPSTLVNALTKILFSLEPGDSTLEDKKDAVGELTNMIGGNVKALLPQPCVLSTPIFAMEGHSQHFPSTKLVTQCQFECQGNFFALSLFEQVKK